MLSLKKVIVTSKTYYDAENPRAFVLFKVEMWTRLLLPCIEVIV